MKKSIPINDILLEKEFQVRQTGTNQAHIEDLIEAYEGPDKDSIPAPVVWQLKGRGDKYYATNFHRIVAQKRLGRAKIECEVRHGTVEDAILHALQSNIGHGLKRSNADKRRCVEMALATWPYETNRGIAKKVGVHHDLVGEIRDKQEAERVAEQEEKNTGGGGSATYEKKEPEKTQDSTKAAPGAQIYTKNDEFPDLKGVYMPRFIQTEDGEKALDAHDNPMPNFVGDTFADATLHRILSQCIRAVEEVDEVMKAIEKATKKGNEWPYLHLPTLEKIRARFRGGAIELQEHIREATPYLVCPACSGAKCKACKASGYLSKGVYDSRPDLQVRKRRPWL